LFSPCQNPKGSHRALQRALSILISPWYSDVKSAKLLTKENLTTALSACLLDSYFRDVFHLANDCCESSPLILLLTKYSFSRASFSTCVIAKFALYCKEAILAREWLRFFCFH